MLRLLVAVIDESPERGCAGIFDCPQWFRPVSVCFGCDVRYHQVSEVSRPIELEADCFDGRADRAGAGVKTLTPCAQLLEDAGISAVRSLRGCEEKAAIDRNGIDIDSISQGSIFT